MDTLTRPRSSIVLTLAAALLNVLLLAPQRAGAETVRYLLGVGGSLGVPDGFSVYEEHSTDDSAAGCLTSGSRAPIWWQASVGSGVEPLAQMLGGAVLWTRAELLERGGSFRVALAERSGYRTVLADFVTLSLVAEVADDADVQRVIDIGRTWRGGTQGCGACRLPAIVPPHRPGMIVAHGGCSQNIVRSPNRTGDVREGPLSHVAISRLASRFSVQEARRQTFDVGAGWLAQPFCSSGRLRRVDMTRTFGRTVEQGSAGTELNLAQLVAVARTLVPDREGTLTFGVGLYPAADTGWPFHIPSRLWMIDGQLAGRSAEGRIASASIYFYQPVTGTVQEYQPPAGSDERASVKVDGAWYWLGNPTRGFNPGDGADSALMAGPVVHVLRPSIGSCGS